MASLVDEYLPLLDVTREAAEAQACEEVRLAS